jgi:hypothetical protein
MALLVLMLAALAPMTGLAAAGQTGPVLSASSTTTDYDSVTGSTCADLTYFDIYDDYTGVVTANPAIFAGFAGNPATEIGVSGSYERTAMGQRVFWVQVDVYSDIDVYESEFEWGGYAALKCLPDGRMQFNFKPSWDYYYDQWNPDTGRYVEGNLGGNARVEMTLSLAGDDAFSFNVYAPVVIHQERVAYEAVD